MTANSEPATEIRTTSPTSCPVCGDDKTLPYREAFDDRYGHPDRFELVYCSGCRHVMTRPSLTESDLAGLYGTYYPRKNITADQVKEAAAKISRRFGSSRRWWMGVDNQGQYSGKPGEKLLDIGCGSGLSLLEARALGVDAWGIEADPNVSRLADQLDLRIHQGSLHDAPFKDVEFNLVVLNQVIEHIPEPDKALQAIRERLAEGGHAVLVFPNINSLYCKLSGSRWINWHVPYHLHHFTLKSFTRMAERCGYRVVRSRTVTPNDWTLLQIRAGLQSIERGKPNPMWSVVSPNNAQSQPTKPGFSLRRLFKVPVMMVVATINRLVDSLGFGDSLVVEIKPVNEY